MSSRPLSPRQKDIAERLVLGWPNKQIANDLNLSLGTVKIHVSQVLARTGAANRTEAALVVFRAVRWAA